MNRLYYSVFSLLLAGILYAPIVGTAFAEPASDEGKSAEEELFSKEELKPDSPLLDSAFEEQHPDNPTKPGEWEEPDIPDSFPELQILDELSQKKSLERMKKARDLYKTAAEIMQSAEPEFEEAKKKIDKLPTTYEWQKQENQARLDREKRTIYAKHRQEAVGYLIQSMRQIDKVANPDLRKSEPFLNLKGAAIREYVKLQFQSGNAGMTISFLEEYLNLKDEHAKEPEPYRLLAIAYKSQEKSARDMGGEEAYQKMKDKKNENILKYAALKYGKDSMEYKRLKMQVDRSNAQSIPIP